MSVLGGGSSWRTLRFHLHPRESFSLTNRNCSPSVLCMGHPIDLEMPLALVRPVALSSFIAQKALGSSSATYESHELHSGGQAGLPKQQR